MKSTLDGWRSAGEPRAPGLGLFVIFVVFFKLYRVFCSLLYHDDKNMKGKNGAEEQSKTRLFPSTFPFASREEFGLNTAMARFRL